MNDPEEMIAAYLDDALDDGQRAALIAWLKADRANVRRFTDALLFEEHIRGAAHAHSAEQAAAGFTLEPEADVESDPRSRWFQWLRPTWAFAAAAAAALAIIGAVLWPTPPVERKAEVATLEVGGGGEWAVPTDALLTETPTVAQISAEISALLQP